MAKSRGFSIYLLKPTFSAENALKEDHNLEQIDEDNTNLPDGSIMYISDKPGNAPWWKNYWGLDIDLYQAQKGAIVFLPVDDRWVVLTFGSTYHQLKDNSFEYDFGLRTTLNALDPKKIKSTDILQPENAKRQRIQSPTASSLNFFDIRHDESIIKKLTGSVKAEYNDLFKNATGANSLRISSDLQPNQIIDLCRSLIEIYEKEDYLQTFPDIRNIEPVRDPDIIILLNEKLLDAFTEAPRELVLSIPEIVDYSDPFKVKYSGAGRSSLEYNDVFIAGYREYLQERNTQIDDVDQFHRHYMSIMDENGNIIRQYNIYKSFLFDCELNEKTYHLCEGEWYFIETDFINRLETSLNPYFIDNHSFLHPCNKVREDAYNNSVSTANANVICLDKKNIAPTGQTQVEPCDLISIIDNTLHLVHVKISTRSSSLSHLFNQGVNSVELLRLAEESQQKLKELVDNNPEICTLIDSSKYSVTYGLITKKTDLFAKSLPIFSRISLLRTVNALKIMGIPCSIFLIYDNIDRKNNNAVDID
ncbi:DUF6119 family protein [Chryseobacterium defluvii]|uniref:Uncharacterized protein (TIGR04141 family) n=1 Tax=Chryseobacterium defluvii TaxID=160396 RepID=A0A495SD61_9FLAO|nr:DUF6119 family protein [Chryseobacterium defluvii]RKS97945.1 uncharacterized protein (TIGR04141 family) [Chryseobacterium defluvii]